MIPARTRRLAALALILGAGLVAAVTPARPRVVAEPPDPYLWLEDVEGKRALSWVEQRDDETRRAFAQGDSFQTLSARIRTILDSQARIPILEMHGDLCYNFWQDRDHPRGIWRRTTLQSYRTDHPAWETMLDLDSLSRAEGVSWVWQSAIFLPPENRLCLVQISRGGSDAQVVREFDTVAKRFVPDGFTLPEAKSNVAWKSRDTLYVGTDFGPGSLTTSGYPRLVKEWVRGTPLASATTIAEAESTDVDISGLRVFEPGLILDVIQRDVAFYDTEVLVRRGDRWVKLDKPASADAGFFRDWILLTLRDPWTTGTRTWPRGSLLATPLGSFLAGNRDFDELFTPTPTRSLSGYTPTRNAILVSTLDDVRSRIFVVRRDHDRWVSEPLPGQTDIAQAEVSAADPLTSDDYFVTAQNFLVPESYSLGTAGTRAPEVLKQLPAMFDTTGLEVTQHQAISQDGTRIPYFQVSRRGMRLDGSSPTLLTGYGGFEISFLPYYSATTGMDWLDKGGTFVTANIRGGGEFGPSWHQAAVKAKRHHTYEDFIAVAEDLIRRKVTSQRHLGCIGGSNGGLLVGNMLTMRPDLWGAIVCESPLLDMKRYHKLLAGASWMAEYGNPDIAQEWHYIYKWSPYFNVKKDVKYPPVLFTTSTRDDRVHPGHARKMEAKMLSYGDKAWLYEDVEGGHPGASTHEERAFMLALNYTFLWKYLR